MSAIWGCIDFSGEALPPDLNVSMQEAVGRYKIDRYDSLLYKNAAMGCGLQYVRQNSVQEALPVFEEEDGILFTMDGMVDNRRELMAILAPEEKEPPCDGRLLYLAYRKWGRDCNAHLRGAYSFAAYDLRENTLLLSADHAFSRAIYYCRQGSRVYFATCIHSILAALQQPVELNQRWLSDYLSLESITSCTEIFETPYLGVNRVGARRYLLFTLQDQKSVIHWDPLTLPPLMLQDDEAYQTRFLALCRRAASEMAENHGPMGIYLSSGMDSSSVAAVMAETLDQQERTLYGYTSVPMTSYQPKKSRFEIQDETDGVQAICRRYPNIRPAFFPSDGLDALINLPDILNHHEIPFKTAPNFMWLHALAEEAHQDGCRIMLNGQMGNSIISWGNCYDLATDQLAAMHPLRALHTLSSFGKSLGISRKLMLKKWTRRLFPKLFGAHAPSESQLLENSLVNPDFSKKLGSAKRMLDGGFYGGEKDLFPLAKIRPILLEQDGITLIGEAETKLGLANGLFIRDLTKDKLVWEFCLTAPIECFVKNGRERRLVRDYLKELLPPEITENFLRYGRQSADWAERLELRWPQILRLLEEGLCSPEMEPFIDPKKLRSILEHMAHEPQPKDYQSLRSLMNIYPAALFLQGFPGLSAKLG